MNWTELTCNTLTQLHVAFIGRARRRHDLIGCSETTWPGRDGFVLGGASSGRKKYKPKTVVSRRMRTGAVHTGVHELPFSWYAVNDPLLWPYTAAAIATFHCQFTTALLCCDHCKSSFVHREPVNRIFVPLVERKCAAELAMCNTEFKSNTWDFNEMRNYRPSVRTVIFTWLIPLKFEHHEK